MLIKSERRSSTPRQKLSSQPLGCCFLTNSSSFSFCFFLKTESPFLNLSQLLVEIVFLLSFESLCHCLQSDMYKFFIASDLCSSRLSSRNYRSWTKDSSFANVSYATCDCSHFAICAYFTSSSRKVWLSRKL